MDREDTCARLRTLVCSRMINMTGQRRSGTYHTQVNMDKEKTKYFVSTSADLDDPVELELVFRSPD